MTSNFSAARNKNIDYTGFAEHPNQENVGATMQL
jgi:hypothetical protein